VLSGPDGPERHSAWQRLGAVDPLRGLAEVLPPRRGDVAERLRVAVGQREPAAYDLTETPYRAKGNSPLNKGLKPLLPRLDRAL